MMSGDSPPDNSEGDVGYGKPPKATRFTKGESGNPGGRPRGRRREVPYETVLGQMVTIREGGVERRVAAAEAFLLQLTKRGLEGDGAAARATLAVIEEIKERSSTHEGLPSVIVRTIVTPGSVTSGLVPLRMAKKLDPYRETARMALEPWLVEAALARLDRRPNPANQRTIVKPLVHLIGSSGPNGGANTPNPKRMSLASPIRCEAAERHVGCSLSLPVP
jgi:hypothetical protein